MTDPGAVATAVLVLSLVWLLVLVGVYVWYALALSKLFPRFGVEGWKGWVPFLNEAEILHLGGYARWFAVFFAIPGVSIVAIVLRALSAHRINRQLGRGAGSTVLAVILPPVWATLLAWGRGPEPGDAGRLAALAASATGAPAWAADPAQSAPTAPVQLPSAPAPEQAPAAPVPAPAVAAPAASASTAAPQPLQPIAYTLTAPPAAPVAPAPAPAIASTMIGSPPGFAPPEPTVSEPPQSWTPPETVVAAPAVGGPLREPEPLAPSIVVPEPAAFAPPAPVHDVTPPPAEVLHPVAAPVAEVAPAPSAFAPRPAPTPAPAPAAPAPAGTVASLLGGDEQDLGEQDDDDDGETIVVDRRPRAHWELVLDGGPRYELEAASVVLGRRPAGSDPAVQYLAVADTTRTLSKSHARLDLTDDGWRISDLSSTNGVIVLDDDGAEHVVQPGTGLDLAGRRFLLGRVTMSLGPIGEAG